MLKVFKLIILDDIYSGNFQSRKASSTVFDYTFTEIITMYKIYDYYDTAVPYTYHNVRTNKIPEYHR